MLHVHMRPTTWILLAIIMLVINVAINARLFLWKITEAVSIWTRVEHGDHSYIAEDYPTWWHVEVGNAEMTFEETVHYPVDGPSAEDEWHSTRAWSSHAGYLRLGPEMRMFTISMIHEMHCINLIRKAIVDRNDTSTSLHHVQHCMTYLRQFFLCSADGTLEPYDFLHRDYQKERVGVTRQCRDWSAVYDALDDNWVHWAAYWRQYKQNKTLEDGQ